MIAYLLDRYHEYMQYLDKQGVVYLDKQYVAFDAGTFYRVALVKYKFKWYKDLLGKWYTAYKPSAIWSDMSPRAFRYLLFTSEDIRTIKPRRYQTMVEKPSELKLEALKTWLEKGVDHEITMGHNESYHVNWGLWLASSEYDSLEQAIDAVQESLNGSYWVPVTTY